MDLKVSREIWDMVPKVSKALLVILELKELLVKLDQLVILELKVYRDFKD